MRVDFYHLTSSPVERALPQLLERVAASGRRAVVMAASPERVEAFNNLLWTYDPDSWLAHGSQKDGSPTQHPIWITEREENPNAATILVLTDGMDAAFLASFERCLDLFDGANDAALAAARERWKRAKGQGHEMHYWQQKPGGGWAEQGV